MLGVIPQSNAWKVLQFLRSAHRNQVNPGARGATKLEVIMATGLQGWQVHEAISLLVAEKQVEACGRNVARESLWRACPTPSAPMRRSGGTGVLTPPPYATGYRWWRGATR